MSTERLEQKYLPFLFLLMNMVYTKQSQLWTLESFTTWSSRFINHSTKIMWMFYQQITWNVSLCEWEELPVLGLFCSCQTPLTVLNTAQQRKYGLLCYIPNVKTYRSALLPCQEKKLDQYHVITRYFIITTHKLITL